MTGYGYGQPGRAVDPSLQAASGMIALNGEPDGLPVRVPVPLIDLMTAAYGVMSVLAALWEVERGRPGQFLDCAMVDSAAMLTSLSVIMAWGGHLSPRRLGSQSAMVVPSQLFEAGDGRFLQIICVSENHWRALCRALGRLDWFEDSRFHHLDGRLAHRDLVHELVAKEIARESATHWVEVITRQGAICELVRDIEDGWSDPRFFQRGLIGHLADATLDTLPLPIVSLIGAADPGALASGPRLGEHNHALKTELFKTEGVHS
jgi:crotonobetainyl-CoA:carnitine CoA-transferase CaiB-like acyl-CoA transferase